MKIDSQKILSAGKELVRPIYNQFSNKHKTELTYWKNNFLLEGNKFENSFYEKIFLNLAQERDDSFLADKVVADFGCGPRGSLKWIKSASVKIGIDVLADQYLNSFGKDMISHEMIYLKSTEKMIPLPSAFVDVMFTLNALDHVDDFPSMCMEINRLIKKGGLLYGSFNLEEKPTSAEPQQLTEKKIHKYLLANFDIITYRLTNKGLPGKVFNDLYENKLHYDKGKEGILWVKAVKK